MLQCKEMHFNIGSGKQLLNSGSEKRDYGLSLSIDLWNLLIEHHCQHDGIYNLKLHQQQ